MSPEERQRAGRAVYERIELMGWTIAEIAERAHIDPKTLRRLMSGQVWPTQAVRSHVEDALEWPRGEIFRQARDGLEALKCFSDAELLAELLRRSRRQEGQHRAGSPGA